MRGQFAILRMGRLSAHPNAMTDDVDDYGESQRTGTARAMEAQRAASAEIPSSVDRVAWKNPAADEPIETNTWNPSPDPPLGDIDFDSVPIDALSSAAADAAPSVLSFFNGKTYDEGLRAYAAHLGRKAAR
jgi:hypothetical protein